MLCGNCGKAQIKEKEGETCENCGARYFADKQGKDFFLCFCESCGCTMSSECEIHPDKCKKV